MSAAAISSFSVADVAKILNLKRQKGKNGYEYHGPHPEGGGATDDGFILYESGNAWDRSTNAKYTSLDVARFAGIEPDEYEPYRNYKGLQTETTFKAGGEASLEEILPAAPKYQTKTLAERGIRPETLQHFYVKEVNARHNDSLPVDCWEFPTMHVSGVDGRSRQKFFDPVEAGKKYDKKQKPMKYRWVPLDNDEIPAAYNLDACVDNPEIWLVGGEVDVWSCWQAGIKAICGFGEMFKIEQMVAAISDLGVEKVHIALDNDDTGHKAAIAAVDACMSNGLAYTVRSIVGLIGSDINDISIRCGSDKDKVKAAIQALPHASKATLDLWRGNIPEEPEKKAKGSSSDEKMQKSERLIHILHKADIFLSKEEDLYVGLVGGDGVKRTYPAEDTGLQSQLADIFYEQTGKVINSEVITNSMLVLRGRARREDSYRPVFIRSGEFEDSIYIDLANKNCDVVRIHPDLHDGWEIVKDPPIHFRRPKGLEELPVPTRGGTIESVRQVINASDDDNWKLMAGWLSYALTPPRYPYPALSLNGEQGTAKSTTSKVLRKLLDPNFTPLIGSSIKDERDLFIMAKNSFVLGFDNLSGMSKWLNDALAQIVTEGAFRTRALRTNEEEIMFKAMRPIILNGIDSDMGREDFKNRCLICTLPVIESSERRDEQDVWGAFYKMWPSVLGAIFTVMATAMRHVDHIQIKEVPRMADFAKWVAAAEYGGAYSWSEGEFLETYFSNISEIQEASMDVSPVAREVQRLMRTNRFLEVTASELFTMLNHNALFENKNSSFWPRSESRMSIELNRMAQNLRTVGIDVRVGARVGKKRRRVIKITQIRHEDAEELKNEFGAVLIGDEREEK